MFCRRCPINLAHHLPPDAPPPPKPPPPPDNPLPHQPPPLRPPPQPPPMPGPQITTGPRPRPRPYHQPQTTPHNILGPTKNRRMTSKTKNNNPLHDEFLSPACCSDSSPHQPDHQ